MNDFALNALPLWDRAAAFAATAAAFAAQLFAPPNDIELGAPPPAQRARLAPMLVLAFAASAAAAAAVHLRAKNMSSWVALAAATAAAAAEATHRAMWLRHGFSNFPGFWLYQKTHPAPLQLSSLRRAYGRFSMFMWVSGDGMWFVRVDLQTGTDMVTGRQVPGGEIISMRENCHPVPHVNPAWRAGGESDSSDSSDIDLSVLRE